jgi:hypothetical protein
MSWPRSSHAPREHAAIQPTLEELWDNYVVDPVEPHLVDAMTGLDDRWSQMYRPAGR